MTTEVRIPSLGESVTEAVVARWLKQDGEQVSADEPILEIETEKAAMEIAAETSGRLEILEPVGARVAVGTVVARIGADAAVGATPTAGARAPAMEASRRQPEPGESRTAPAPPAPVASAPSPGLAPERAVAHVAEPTRADGGAHVAPADRPDQRPSPADPRHLRVVDGEIERVPMSEIRRTIATRLVEAQRQAAILTTFNEVDLGELLALRARHRERFKATHGVDLGLVSLFARATVLALHELPILNARIEGGDIVYHHRVHLGIAVATPRGLVVPVVRNADAMTVADLERAIGGLAERARTAKVTPDELAGGTFSITNGGVFGSLLSTPLLNPPQSGILGMHKIQERPIAVGGQPVIRPMMYVALSYDHRLVDGEQAVRFLVRVKDQLEDPARMLLAV
jgi:2-oxoglutarate dehydrogenase E2 component (dihydrolipoamide succinyltransferase)